MFTLKDTYLADPRWRKYPLLKDLAVRFLDDIETVELFSLIACSTAYNDYMLEDRHEIEIAFSFSRTPQGWEYWRRVADRINSRIEAEMTGMIDNEQPAKPGWEPDKVDGASVMDATRNLF